MSESPGNVAPRWIAWRRWSYIVGIASALALGLGASVDPAQFFRAYLGAYLSLVGLATGALAILMIYHLTGGAWGYLIRRFLERAVRTLPLVAVGFVPIVIGARYLYPFAQADAVAGSELLQFQQAYLNVQYFALRATGYFLLWIVLAFLLLALARRERATGDAKYARWCEHVSGPGLVAYGVSIHFTSVDWLLSLQPAFHSTIFGPIVASGQILSAAALAIVLLALSSDRPPLVSKMSTRALNDLGNLLLAFVIVWGYLVWVQYMLIWIGNLPVDAVWYAPRLRDGWQWCALGLAIFGFAIPLVALLWRNVKQNLVFLAATACVLLLAQVVFNVYQVSPPFKAQGLSEHWMEVVAPLALGATWFGVFLTDLTEETLLPAHDANEAAALRLRLADEREAAWEEIFAHG